MQTCFYYKGTKMKYKLWDIKKSRFATESEYEYLRLDNNGKIWGNDWTFEAEYDVTNLYKIFWSSGKFGRNEVEVTSTDSV